MYCAPCATWLWLAAAAGAPLVAAPPAWQPAATGADLRGNIVGIDAQQAVIAERPDVGHAQRGGSGELPLDGEIPFLHRGSFRIGLDALRRIGGAGRGHPGAARWRNGRAGNDGRDGEERARSGDRAVVRRQRVQQEAEIVDQRIVGSEAGADGVLPSPKGSHARPTRALKSLVALFCVKTELPTRGAVSSTPVASGM